MEFTGKQLAPATLSGSDISISDLAAPVKSHDEKFFENPDVPGRIVREAEMFKEAELMDSIQTIKSGSTELISNILGIKISPIEANRVFSPTSAITKGDNADTSIGVMISIAHLNQIVKI